MKLSRAVSRGVIPALAMVAACSFTGGAVAADPARQQPAERASAQAKFKLAWDSCRKLQGNARDLCKVEARGGYEVAKAELAARHKSTPKNDDKLKVARAKAAYNLAWEKCDDLSGNAKDVCQKDASALLVTSRHDTKLSRASVDKGVNSRAAVSQRKDAREGTSEAQYDVAKERCDDLTGAAKTICVQDAKDRFGKK